MGTSIHTQMEYKDKNNNWIEFSFNNYEKYGLWNNDYYPWLKFIGNIPRVQTIEANGVIYNIDSFKDNENNFFGNLPTDLSIKIYERYQKT